MGCNTELIVRMGSSVENKVERGEFLIAWIDRAVSVEGRTSWTEQGFKSRDFENGQVVNVQIGNAREDFKIRENVVADVIHNSYWLIVRIESW